jgi:hypothetical protein
MNFSLATSKEIVPDDIRATFKALVQEEIATCDPVRGVSHLYSNKPEQLKFNFTLSKQVST